MTMTSPYNYPNPNMTFQNPYMARSCKRALNTSSSSVGSRASPRTKRARHNISASTNQSLVSCCSLDTSQPQLVLDKTLETSACSYTEDTEDTRDCSNNNLLCLSCSDLQPVVAVCTSCPEQPSLCQLCLDAHKRVRLTREHKVLMMEEQPCTLFSATAGRPMSQVLQSLIELIDLDKKLAGINLDDSITSTTAELVRTWSVTSAKSDDKKYSQDKRRTEDLIRDNLVPIFSQGALDVKTRAAAIIQTLIEIQVVNASWFVEDECIEGFKEMINTKETVVIVAALDCLQCLVKEVARLSAKFSLIKLHSQLEKQLRRLKDSEAGYTTCVQFKAGKLIREMEKCLME